MSDLNLETFGGRVAQTNVRRSRNQRVVIGGRFAVENEVRRVERDRKFRNAFAEAAERVDGTGNRAAFGQNGDGDAGVDRRLSDATKALELLVVRRAERRRFDDERNGAQRFREAQAKLELREIARVFRRNVEEKSDRSDLAVDEAKTRDGVEVLRDPLRLEVVRAVADGDFGGAVFQVGELIQTLGERKVRKTTGRGGDKQRENSKKCGGKATERRRENGTRKRSNVFIITVRAIFSTGRRRFFVFFGNQVGVGISTVRAQKNRRRDSEERVAAAEKGAKIIRERR